MNYRKWVYHKTESPKIVESKEEHEALKAQGWEESPFESEKIESEKQHEQKADQPKVHEEKHKDEVVILKKRKHKGDV